MESESSQPSSALSSIESHVIYGILGPLALFAPAFIMMREISYDTDVIIQAGAWMWTQFGPIVQSWPFDLELLIYVFPFAILRLTFVYQVARYYQGQSTRARTLIAGLIIALLPTIPYWLLMVAFPAGWGTWVLVPTPLMLLAAAMLMWRRPIFTPSTPWDGL
jgi:hypothetical protein